MVGMHIQLERYPRPSKVPWLLLVLVLVLAGTAAHRGHELYEEEQARAEAAREEAERARERALAAEQAREALTEELATLGVEQSREPAGLARSGQEGKPRGAELVRLQRLNAELARELKEVSYPFGTVRLWRRGERLHVVLEDRLLFGEDGQLTEGGAEVLTRLGAVLAKAEDRVLQVSGHTDEGAPEGSLAKDFPTNWELSAARAVRVVRFLGEKAGIPERRLVAAGYAGTRRVSGGASPRARARNQRVEILVVPAPPSDRRLARTVPSVGR